MNRKNTKVVKPFFRNVGVKLAYCFLISSLIMVTSFWLMDFTNVGPNLSFFTGMHSIAKIIFFSSYALFLVSGVLGLSYIHIKFTDAIVFIYKKVRSKKLKQKYYRSLSNEL
jgi:hypothetical protein